MWTDAVAVVWPRRARTRYSAADARSRPAGSGADPASVAFDGLDYGIAHNKDVILIDTAGRLHTSVNLMAELKKVRRVLEKRLPGAPHEILQVLDATTGQNGLSQARLFHEAVGVTCLALTKLDGTAKGGIVANISRITRGNEEFHVRSRRTGPTSERSERAGGERRQDGGVSEGAPGDEHDGGDEQRGEGNAGDRKSTRLNSSHLVISYAVFCLKKKSGS